MYVPRRIRTIAAATIATVLTLSVAGTAFASDSAALTCDAFTFQEDAQVLLDRDLPKLPGLVVALDGDDDGVACESLPRRDAAIADALDTGRGPDARKEDKDEDQKSGECADFATQADAQAALAKRPSDKPQLDTNDNGIACEDHFKTEEQQVAVHPVGGVATGGTSA
ncbi:MAG: excalibur calcium-binding domain-containing protein [Pseudonocardia sp.]